MINLDKVSRTYKEKNGTDFVALNQISLNVKKGTIHGLIGPNGAGKSTTMKILSTLLLPSSGTVTMKGIELQSNLNAVRQDINFIYGGERDLYWRLTARENLEYFSALYSLKGVEQKEKIKELLELVQLTDVANKKVETYSKGMKQRLQIARGLLNNPRILLLDEPTIGLDRQSAEEFKNIIRHLAANGTTILFTSHYLEEVEDLSDEITIISRGEIVASGTAQELRSNIGKELYVHAVVENVVNRKQAITLFSRYFGDELSVEKYVERTGNVIEMKVSLSNKKLDDVKLSSFVQNSKIREWKIGSPSLDEIYRYYTTV